MAIYWPILLVVFSNIFYHVCAKVAPKDMDPLLITAVSYIIGAIIALLIYFNLNRSVDIIHEIKKTNWAVWLFAFAIIGLELGNIYMYKCGWNINTGFIIQSSLLTVALLFIGYIFFNEPITMNKVIGIIACLVGLFFINK